MARFGSKQPYEEYYVAFDFTADVGEAAIASAEVIVYDSSEATCTSTLTDVANQSLATTSVNVWVQGGETGQEYKITCRIETNSTPAEKFELDGTLPVEEK